jgi:hypothetical protein
MSDRLLHKLRTLFVSVRSALNGTVQIKDYLAGARGTIQQGSELQPGPGLRPDARVNTQNVLSATERNVYVIGGQRQQSSGESRPTGEIWRYNLDSGEWDRLGVGKATGAPLGEVLSATYDPSINQLYLASKTRKTSPFSTVDLVRLTSVDTRSGVGRELQVLPAIATSARGLAVTSEHTIVLATQKNAQTIELFELDPAPIRPSLVGYAALSGKLDGDFFAPDDVEVPVVIGGTPHVRTVSLSTLRQKVDLSSVADQDKDGVLDVLDDCPKTYNPAQSGCLDQSQAVLFAGSKLVVTDRVQITGPATTLVSGGTALTKVGVDAQIGSLVSRGPVEMGDRARASGSVLSGGAVTLGQGAGATGGVKPNAAIALDALANFTVAFPAAGAPLTLAPDQRKTLEPGSFGAGTLYSRSILTLTAGNYYFTSMTVEPNASIVVDSSAGPARIYLKSGFIFRGALLDQFGGFPKVLTAYFGTTPGLIEASFDGMLVAPKAKLVLASTAHSGAFFANEIEVQAGATIAYVPVPVSWWPTGS